MVNGVERAEGGRIIPVLRYRNAKAAIDWLGMAFGFEAKMVVPGEGERIAHAELVLENGMIMLGDAETEYGNLVRPPAPPDRVNTQSTYVVVADVDGHYARAKAPVPRSCSTSRRKTMAAATTPVAISKATSGPSALTILG
jgi:hypothetical protein